MADGQEKSAGTTSHGIRHVLGGSALVAVFIFILGIFVRLLWNWLMPGIFGLRAITYFEAVGLMLLARLLFGRVGQKRDHAGYLSGKYGFRRIFGRGETE